MTFDLGLVSEGIADEPRTLFRPSEVRSLRRSATICVESGIGSSLGFDDRQYEEAGAVVVEAAEAWRSRVVAKFKAPTLEQIPLLGAESTVAAMMHAEGKPSLVACLLQQRARAIAFEFLTLDGSTYPAMSATGEISGRQAVTFAAYHLQRPRSGSGRMFAALPNSPGARVTVIGFGNVGSSAAHAASGLGARVRVVHWTDRRHCECGYECTGVGDPSMERIISESDVVIGALRISTFDTPRVVSETAVKSMRPGSVVVDVTAGYGPGYIETSTRVTTLRCPVRVVHGVSHIKIRNFPRAVPHESVASVSAVFAPLVEALLEVPQPRWTTTGLIAENGRVVHDEVQRHFARVARR